MFFSVGVKHFIECLSIMELKTPGVYHFLWYLLCLVLCTYTAGLRPAILGLTPPQGPPQLCITKKDLQEDWLGPPGDSHARPIPGHGLPVPVLYYPGYRHAFADPRSVRIACILRPYDPTKTIRVCILVTRAGLKPAHPRHYPSSEFQSFRALYPLLSQRGYQRAIHQYLNT